MAAAAILALAALIMYAIPMSAWEYDEEEFAACTLPDSYTNILLLGIDINSSGSSRTDVMMIASIGKDKLYLTSIQRDTGVYFEGSSQLRRLNGAYNYGGENSPERVLRTINLNFGLNLTRYMLVDYAGFETIVDAAGGVDIAGITDAEAHQINTNMYEIMEQRYKKGLVSYAEGHEILNNEYLVQGGDYHLSGLQALGFARIRKIDSDYSRTGRQREIMTGLIKQVTSNLTDLPMYVRLLKSALPVIETNMSLTELISLGEKIILNRPDMVEKRLPKDGTYTDDGSMFYDVDYAANRKAFCDMLYGEGAY